MTYLTRLVLDVKPNWEVSPVEEFAYDLRGIRVGFGSSVFAPTQTHVARGWSMTFTFGSEFEFARFQDLVGSRKGMLDGMWFPNPAFQFKSINGISTTEFDIASQNLAGTYVDDPCLHLYAIGPTGVAEAVAISSVSSPSAGVERITLSTPLSAAPDSTWWFYRLLYVRIAEDDERSVAHCEGVYSHSLKVIELPEEYAAAETGRQPVYLYDFWQDNGDATFYHWRYTSFSEPIASNGDTFFPKNINHGSLRQSTRAEQSQLAIQSTYYADAPWADHVPFPSTRPLNLTLYEVQLPTPNSRTTYFSGECSGCEFDGTDVSISFDHWFDSLRTQLPGRTIQPRCHYQVFDSTSCKAVASSYSSPSFQLTGSITVISGNTVTVTHANFGASPAQYPLNFFAGGKIRCGTSPKFEERMVVSSTAASGGAVVLTLSLKLIHQTTLPTSCVLTRGCDRFYSTCKNVFGNHVNFPGFVDVPRVNPTFKAIEVAQGTAGKK